jgi:hypothetical protein
MCAKDGLSGLGREFYQREFEFFSQITGVSGKIRSFELGPARKVSFDCPAVDDSVFFR